VQRSANFQSIIARVNLVYPETSYQLCYSILNVVLSVFNNISINSVASLGECRGQTAPGDTIRGRGVTSWWKSKNFFADEITKNTGEIITWKLERVGVVTILLRMITKKDRHFSEEKIGRHHELPHRVTPTLVTPLHKLELSFVRWHLAEQFVMFLNCQEFFVYNLCKRFAYFAARAAYTFRMLSSTLRVFRWPTVCARYHVLLCCCVVW